MWGDHPSGVRGIGSTSRLRLLLELHHGCKSFHLCRVITLVGWAVLARAIAEMAPPVALVAD